LFGFLIRRFLNLIPTAIGASIVIFVALQAAPGNFLTPLLLQPNIDKSFVHHLMQQYGLDAPIYVQYWKWFSNVITGHLGYSFAYSQPVWQVIFPRVIHSLYIVILSTILLYAIAIPIGVYSATHQYSLGDKIISTITYFFIGIPSFFFALIAILIVLEIRYATGWQIPVGGMTSHGFANFSEFHKILDILKHIAIPAVIVVLDSIARLSRYLRAQMLEYLGSDFIRTARSKGISEFKVNYKHALRNAIIPFVATIGFLLPALISGAGFVEIVFAYPGITPLLINSIFQRDIFVAAGFLIISVVILIIGNVIGDILLSVVDPRIKYA
jgi:peptide/nickel transport system permease protein